MSEYIYATNGEPVANIDLDIYLARDEIVRCRDCAYNAKDVEHICYRFTHTHYNQPNGFCSWGERK